MKAKSTHFRKTKSGIKQRFERATVVVNRLGVVRQKLVASILVVLLMAIPVVSPLGVATVSAQQQQLGNCTDADNNPATVGCSCEGDFVPSTDGTQCIPATQTDCNAKVLNSQNCQVVKYVVILINFLTALAGIAVVGGMTYGGYLYQTARDNPGQVQAGRQKIVWALIALIILVFGYAGLQWLVPGGLLHGSTSNTAL